MAGLLPYLGNNAHFNQINFNLSWREGPNALAASGLVPQFLDPTYPSGSHYVKYPGMPLPCAATHYVGIAGVGGDAAEAKHVDPPMNGKLGNFGYKRMTKLETIAEKVRG
jgi:hypothetical protein